MQRLHTTELAKPLGTVAMLLSGFSICVAPFLTVATSFASTPAVERPQRIAALCDNAAQIAAQNSNVPVDVLRAITRTETGRGGKSGLTPWPWTVNMEGTGKWFETEVEARSYVAKHFDRGARSFDVGCFQINYKWHHEAFASIDEMFDPTANAHYAARFLSDLYGEFGSWTKAAGAFHSRTPKYADKYMARFDRIRSELTPDLQFASVKSTQTLQSRTTFTGPSPLVAGHRPTPLLAQQNNLTNSHLGSLVPLNGSSSRSLIAFR